NNEKTHTETQVPGNPEVPSVKPGMRRGVFILQGSLSEIDEIRLKGIEKALQTITGDATLTVFYAEEGSIRIIFDTNPEALARLQEMVQSGNLTKILDYPIEDVQLLQDNERQNSLIKLVKEVLPEGEAWQDFIGANLVAKSAMVPVTAGATATAIGLEIDARNPSAPVELDASDRQQTLVPFQPVKDSVRAYLSEIGRVPLLKRDEEVSEAQKVWRYTELLAARAASARAGDRLLKQLEELLDLQKRLRVQLNHQPSFERWASEANLTVAELKQQLQAGKQRWAQVTGIDIREIEIVERCGQIAKDRMLRANLRLVVSVAKKYQNRGLDLLDLIQEGTLGLERAVEKFVPTKGYRFNTYAYWWIRQGITRALASQSRMIRIPVHVTEKLNKLRKAQRQLWQENGRVPQMAEIARLAEMEPKEASDVMRCLPTAISLEQKVGKDRDTELSGLLEAGDRDTPERRLVQELLGQDLRALLLELTEREQTVIELRYGLGEDKKPHSLAEVGRLLEISRERVRQIEAKAMHKLKQPKYSNRIRDYLEAFS
ncbi:MAG: sigma-70 family RNA polymerase sigma factor, partial [Cyanobacteria bacterium J06641_5]